MARAKQARSPVASDAATQLVRAAPAFAVAASAARPAIGLAPTPQPGLKARQLFQAARAASLDHVSALQAAIAGVEALLDDVVEGGAIYAPGLSDFAGRLREDLFWRAKTLESLAQKQRLTVEGAS
jgi:hypothetical protein